MGAGFLCEKVLCFKNIFVPFVGRINRHVPNEFAMHSKNLLNKKSAFICVSLPPFSLSKVVLISEIRTHYRLRRPASVRKFIKKYNL